MGLYTAGAADDPSLMNPLLRQERLGTGWFGVIIGEMDGVLVDSTQDAHAQVSFVPRKASWVAPSYAWTLTFKPLLVQAWLAVSQEMNLPRPLGQVLRRIQGARDEVVSALRDSNSATASPAMQQGCQPSLEAIAEGIMPSRGSARPVPVNWVCQRLK